MRIGRRLQPLLVLRNSKKIPPLISLRNAYNRRNELDEEARDLEERRVEVVEEIDEETLDMAAVVILHNAHTSVYALCEEEGG